MRAVVSEHPTARAIVDLPASGHGLDWLRVPVAAERFLRAGPAAELCRRLREQVLSRERSAIVIVSTVEPVVASETRELCARLALELDRTPNLLVANRVPHSPTREQLQRLQRAAQRDPAWGPIRAAAAEDWERSREATGALNSLQAIAGAPVIRVPELYVDPSPQEFLTHLGGTL